MGADGVVIEDWCAMILQPQGELKPCQAASNENYLGIARDALLHWGTRRESHMH